MSYSALFLFSSLRPGVGGGVILTTLGSFAYIEKTEARSAANPSSLSYINFTLCVKILTLGNERSGHQVNFSNPAQKSLRSYPSYSFFSRDFKLCTLVQGIRANDSYILDFCISVTWDQVKSMTLPF